MMLRNTILQILRFFYQPFSKVMPWQTFRYLACGGGNTAMDILLYFVCYNFVLHDLVIHKQMVHLGILDMTPHIAALFMSMAVTFPTGFLLSKYVVFSESNLRGRVQLFRYFVLVGICIVLNYVLMKVFVDQFHFFPTIGKICTTALVVVFSYLTQKKFTFKVKQQQL